MKSQNFACRVVSPSGESSSCNQVSGFESKCSIKYPVKDSRPMIQEAHWVTQLSVYRGQRHRQSVTEASECHSIALRNRVKVERTINPFDFVERRKVSSTYRCSTGSDVNDVRWIAIRKAQSNYGLLQFTHFRLLNHLGCGDVGKVYLSEFVGTKTHFAMKVMNKAALESRKKLLRAQTEREILQSLDHPFLPTLYTHFETENYSCLVMEFCPGGGLHSLRQRQPHKCFTEHAAR
ncbi:hypothetical protein SOVF_105910 [Spinacia oleracea]|nr:hypothetical protein SOVF_105910 [Spinacia oleracea]